MAEIGKLHDIAYYRGFDASVSGDGLNTCPYRKAFMRREWMKGYQNAERERKQIISSSECAA